MAWYGGWGGCLLWLRTPALKPSQSWSLKSWSLHRKCSLKETHLATSKGLFIYEDLILAVDLCSIQASSLCNAKETWEQLSCIYLMETLNPMQI